MEKSFVLGLIRYMRYSYTLVSDNFYNLLIFYEFEELNFVKKEKLIYLTSRDIERN